AYLYIFTAYDGESWKADQPMYSISNVAVLEPWALEMLTRWAKNDPVDTKEITRNEEIFKIQKNRNPFIDYPDLIDYIWGDKQGLSFTPGEGAEAIDRPMDPVFSSRRMTGVNTYASRWWEGEMVGIEHHDCDLWVSLNGGEYQQYGPGVSIPAASEHGLPMTIRAYTEAEKEGYTLKSSVATLTLIGKDPRISDYTEALYQPVVSATEFSKDYEGYYIVQSVSNGHIMGHEGGTSSSSFMPDAGSGVIRDNDEICHLPVEAAVVRFRPSDGGKYLLEVFDAMRNQSKGYWNVGGSGNKNTLKPNTGTAASVSFNEDGTAVISFEGGKSLQYNKTQPRFTNYSSAQGGIRLARFLEFYDLPSAVVELPAREDEGCIAIDGNNIILPEGWVLYQLNGRQSDGRSLEPGIYIARSLKGKAVKIMIGR
ncbi:MAG: endonuclease, partial [Muribaculaceae bacterium]|nr:endonuclease [Muribaculaceae bacterium]